MNLFQTLANSKPRQSLHCMLNSTTSLRFLYKGTLVVGPARLSLATSLVKRPLFLCDAL